MKRFTILSLLILLSVTSFAVDIEQYFASSSTGKYYPFVNNGTIQTKFDFIVDSGPISSSFVIAFVLSEDINVFDHNDIVIDKFTVSSAGNGSSEFPTDFGTQAPYIIDQMLKKANIVHGKTYFVGCILDYDNDIAESNENNNSGPIQMPPITVSGNIGFDTDLGFWKSSINPNPINTSAVIELEGTKITNAEILIYTVEGKLIRTASVSSFPYTFYRRELAVGIYNMIITNDGKAIIRKKIIIQ
jgi:hypothetical protein